MIMLVMAIMALAPNPVIGASQTFHAVCCIGTLQISHQLPFTKTQSDPFKSATPTSLKDCLPAEV